MSGPFDNQAGTSYNLSPVSSPQFTGPVLAIVTVPSNPNELCLLTGGSLTLLNDTPLLVDFEIPVEPLQFVDLSTFNFVNGDPLDVIP